jgi:hypothetical protein
MTKPVQETNSKPGRQKEGEEKAERQADHPSVLEQAVSKFQIFPEECSASQDDQDLGRQ